MRKLHNEETVCTVYQYSQLNLEVKSWSVTRMAKKIETFKILTDEPIGKRTLGIR